MAIKEHRGSRRRDIVRRPNADELAAIRALGRQWREEWRAAQTARPQKAGAPDVSIARRADPDRKASARNDFAAGITRAEFGRFYWDERRALAAGGARRSRRGRANKAHE